MKNKTLKKLLLFILIAGVIEFVGAFIILTLSYDAIGDFRKYPEWVFTLIDIFSFILFFPLSGIEYLLNATGHEVRYYSNNKGLALFFGIYFINLIAQFFILRGFKILISRLRHNSNKQSSL